ncbi:MAG TPA: isocitrate/isopropylmalate family dehydrogenase, partial [Planctomycetota bacterium]|nr:isocitrate/isopropylmalate family dehydrogenase [Planctomycetota bacterium]
HGSAPKYKGQNKANPVATIMAVSMMLDYLGQNEAAAGVEETVADLIRSGQIRSLSAGVHGTDEIGDMVVSSLRSRHG